MVSRLILLVTTLQLMWADACYDGKPLRDWMNKTAGITLEVVKRTSPHTFQVVKRRWVVETSKPQCCHNRGWPASLRAPSCSVPVRVAWFFSQGRRLCWPRGTWCKVRSRSTSAGSARTTVRLMAGCR